MLEVRTAKLDDREGIRALWELCFDDTKAFIDWFFTNRYYPYYSACLLEGGIVMSAMQGSPMHLNIRGHTLPALMLAGVSTHPERFGKGYMRRVFEHFMQIARGADIPIVFHTPATMPTFFSRGHYPASDTLWLTAQRASEDKFPEDIVSQSMTENLDALHARYQSLHEWYSGGVSRSISDFYFKFKDYAADGARCFVFRNNDEVAGYCVYYEGEDKIHAEEVIADTPHTYEKLIHALRYEARGRDLRCKLPPDIKLNKRLGKADIRPQGAMGAADISRLLATIIHDPGFVFEVEDSTVPQNNGVWDGLGRLITSGRPHIRLNSGRLMQFLLGYRSIGQLCGEGNAVILDKCASDALESMLSVKSCFVVDEY